MISSFPDDDDNDDNPDDVSDNDNDDGTQPSAHHHRDICAYLTSSRRMRHTSITRRSAIRYRLNTAQCLINRFSVDWVAFQTASGAKSGAKFWAAFRAKSEDKSEAPVSGTHFRSEY